MLTNAAVKLGIALEKSYMIGDRSVDITAGKAAGCKTVFIDLDYEAETKPANQDYTATSVGNAVLYVLNAGNHKVENL